MAYNRNGDLEKCQQGMFHSFEFTGKYHAPMLKDARPRSEKDLRQLRELVFCGNNPEAYGCNGARPVDQKIRAQYERVIPCATFATTRCHKPLFCGLESLRLLHKETT